MQRSIDLRSIVKNRYSFQRWSDFFKQRKVLTSNYINALSLLKADHSVSIGPLAALRDYWPWVKSMAFSNGPLEDALPWMPFVAIRYLETLLRPDSRVFEFGAGGSTMFFSTRVAELASVEHDRGWLTRTEEAMISSKVKWQSIFAPPVTLAERISLPPSDVHSYTTSDEQFKGQSFHQYATAIDRFPDGYFDVILIDGRSRPSCFLHSIPKIKTAGVIILDNAERESYAEVEILAKSRGFSNIEFWGPGPFNPYCWRTVFLRSESPRVAIESG